MSTKGGCGCGSSTGIVKTSGAPMKKSCGCGKGGGCSCGGGGKKSCGCGGCGCDACQADGYVRPIFFGGQLLTEDDLQALVDYVVGKNKLHNRMLFGAGVVCGLEVVCDPCDCNKITVKPGYALDCCGNDIVVPCPVTLDINQLVRDLKAAKGVDCGDPCARTPSPPSTTPLPVLEKGSDTKSEKKPARRYCLYLRYCEASADPVAPYATDDCTPQGCQPSRLKEGYTFELRCEESDVEPASICDRLHDCRPSRERLEEAQMVAATFAPLASAIKRALAEPEGPRIANPAERWQDAHTKLSRTLDELGKEPAMPELLTATAQLLTLARVEAEIIVAHDKSTATTLARSGGATLPDLATRLHEALPKSMPESYATTFVKETSGYFTHPLAKQDPFAVRIVAFGGTFIPTLLKAAAQPVQRIYQRLALTVEKPTGTSCQIKKQLDDYNEPELDFTVGTTDFVKVMRSAASIRWLSQSAVRVEQECMCEAFLPPCNDCDEDAVLLACLTVRDCCVDTICNLERDFVLTGPNLRYWQPSIDRWFEALEDCCCPESCDEELSIHRADCMERLLVGIHCESRAPMLPWALATRGSVTEAAAMELIAKASTPAPPATTTLPTLDTIVAELTRLREAHDELKRQYDDLKQHLPKSKAQK
jgi:hypothetical protein